MADKIAKAVVFEKKGQSKLDRLAKEAEATNRLKGGLTAADTGMYASASGMVEEETKRETAARIKREQEEAAAASIAMAEAERAKVGASAAAVTEGLAEKQAEGAAQQVGKEIERHGDEAKKSGASAIKRTSATVAPAPIIPVPAAPVGPPQGAPAGGLNPVKPPK